VAGSVTCTAVVRARSHEATSGLGFWSKCPEGPQLAHLIVPASNKSE